MKYAAFLTLVVSVFTQSAQAHILEREDISVFSVSSKRKECATEVRVRGVIKQSAYTVGSPIYKTHGETMQVKLPLSRSRFGKQQLDLLVTIPATVKVLVFGNKQVEIWPTDKLAPKWTDTESRAISAAKNAFSTDHPDLNIEDYFVNLTASNPSTYSVSFAFLGAEGQIFTYELSSKTLDVSSKRECYFGPMRK